MTVTVVLGLVGGVGTTRLAVATARRSRDAMGSCIVDLDLEHGNVAHELDVRATRTLADLALLSDAPVAGEQVQAVTYQARGGLRVVPAPACAELAEVVPAAAVSALIRLHADTGPVVVDGGSRFGVCTLAACRLADDVVLVARDDSFCRMRARKTVDLLARAGITSVISVAVPMSRPSVAGAFAADVGLLAYHDVLQARQTQAGATRRGRTLRSTVAPLARRLGSVGR